LLIGVSHSGTKNLAAFDDAMVLANAVLVFCRYNWFLPINDTDSFLMPIAARLRLFGTRLQLLFEAIWLYGEI
jgi:hypothetical protein